MFYVYREPIIIINNIYGFVHMLYCSSLITSFCFHPDSEILASIKPQVYFIAKRHIISNYIFNGAPFEPLF